MLSKERHQTDESDIDLLTRIDKVHDAIATVKGVGKISSDIPMIPRASTKPGGLSWSMTLATRGNFESEEAHWHNEVTGKKETATAGRASPVKRLRRTYTTKTEAEGAAKAKLNGHKRGGDTLSITMQSDPLVAAGGGFTAQIKTEKPTL